MGNVEKKEPLYLQIYNSLKSDMLNNIYSYGDKLPSKRVLSDMYNVSIITVEHAYDLLLSEGYVESKEKKGYFSIYSNDDAFLLGNNYIKNNRINNVIINKNAFPFNLYAKTVRKVLSSYNESIFNKCDVFGSEILRIELSNFLNRVRKMKVTKDNIVVGAGAEYLYGLLIDYFGYNITVAIEDPCYEKIKQVYKSKGVKCEFIELKEDGLDSDKLKRSRANILHITPYRSYPSNVSASPSKRNEYIRWANANDSIIVEDDFESEFSLHGKMIETLFSMSNSNNVIYINTFSKTISPSIRIAYMVLPDVLIESFKQKLGFYSCTVPTFDQIILAELIRSGEFERNINRIRRQLKKSRTT